MVFDSDEFTLKVIKLLPTQWVRSFGAYEALEVLGVDDYISMVYYQLDKTQLEAIIKLCIENVDPEFDIFSANSPYAVLDAINSKKSTVDELAHCYKNTKGINQSRIQLLLDKGKFTGEMYALTRSDKCKDPEFILAMYCDKPAKRIQKAWQRYRRNKSARIIQTMVKEWLYRPGGAMMKRAEARFYRLAYN